MILKISDKNIEGSPHAVMVAQIDRFFYHSLKLMSGI